MAHEDSDTESGLPESVSLSSSASAAKGHDHALRNFHAAEKCKIREKNRLRDERLKAQAQMRPRVTATTGKGRLYVGNHGLGLRDNEGGREMDPRSHSRITHALADTEQAVGGSTGEEEWGGINNAHQGDSQVAPGQDVEAEREEDARNADLDVGDDGDQSLASRNKYLPVHIFVAALSNPKPKIDVRPSRTTPRTRSSTSSRKRKSMQTRPKDVVIGWVSIPHTSRFSFCPLCSMNLIPSLLSSRTVRTSLSSPASARGTTLPPTRINKFLANALGFKRKGNKVSMVSPRCERRPCTSCISCECSSLNRGRCVACDYSAHLGVMKRTTGAPMTGFARPSQH
jgi:hypothetical protein